jgi:hypothetical protein
MRAIARNTGLLAGFFSFLLLGDSGTDIRDLLRDVAGAMAEGNARRVVSFIDPNLPGFARLERDVTALVEQYEVTSAIDTLRDEGDDRAHSLELDWYLQIRTRDLTGVLERRRQAVKCRVEKQGRKWRIVALDPLEFFAPPKP